MSLVFFREGTETSEGWRPDSFYPKLAWNRQAGLHTLCLLDIKTKEPNLEMLMRGKKVYDPPRFMSVAQAAAQLIEVEHSRRERGEELVGAYDKRSLAIGMARIGRPTQRIVAGTLAQLAAEDLGAPLHSLVLPGALHFIEEEMLAQYRLPPPAGWEWRKGNNATAVPALLVQVEGAADVEAGCAEAAAEPERERKPGVASDAAMRAFLSQHHSASSYNAGEASRLVVVDVRDPEGEGDSKAWGVDSSAPVLGLGDSAVRRPSAVSCAWDKEYASMPLEETALAGADKSTPIITHCGGGGRGQAAKEYLEDEGFANVINGGGPNVAALWEMYGEI